MKSHMKTLLVGAALVVMGGVALAHHSWTSKTLKPGDELALKVDPLRSGAPGGAWNVNKIKFKNGDPIVATH